MGSGFFSLFFLFSFFLVGTSVARASVEIPVPTGFTLPQVLPYNDGTTVWNYWIASTDGGNFWRIFYTNVGNFTLLDYALVSPLNGDNVTCFSSSDNGHSWSVPDIGGCNLGNPASFSLAMAGAGSTVRNLIISSYPIFSSDAKPDSYTWDPLRWVDTFPHAWGALIINKVNFDLNGVLIGVQDPAIYQIVNNTSSLSDYTALPSPITDPTGFISGVFTNFFVFIYKGFIPPDGYLTEKLAEVTNAWSLDQPGLTSVSSAFSTGITALSTPTAMTPISMGSLHFGGVSTSSITVFDPSTQPVGMFDSAKTLISAFMYFGVGFWVIRQMSSIFSA